MPTFTPTMTPDEEREWEQRAKTGALITDLRFGPRRGRTRSSHDYIDAPRVMQPIIETIHVEGRGICEVLACGHIVGRIKRPGRQLRRWCRDCSRPMPGT